MDVATIPPRARGAEAASRRPAPPSASPPPAGAPGDAEASAAARPRRRVPPAALAALLALALAGWLASRPAERWLRGEAGRAAATATVPAPAPAGAPLASVRVTRSRAAPVSPGLAINGRTAPARAVRLRAEADGRVVATPAAEGALVEAGAVLLAIDERDRRSRVREAEARLAQRELEHEAARQLGERGFQARTRVAEAAAELEATRAALHEARLDLERTEVKAPFRGVLEARAVELGDYADKGLEVALVIEQDPYLVVGDAPETLAARFRPGQAGRAALADGRVVEGRVRFVAGEADPGTRTFRVELEVPNPGPGARFPAGMSARLLVAEPPVMAHRVSAAALVLDDAGAVGALSVDGGGVVRFHPARIVEAEAGAVWLAGLPESLRIVTTGQGFVRAGQRVEARPEPADGAGAAVAASAPVAAAAPGAARP